MKNNLKINNEGFASIALVICISSIILLFTLTNSIESLQFFDMTLRKQYRLMNYYNAYNCIDRAILRLASDYFYEIDSPQVYIDLNCQIEKVKRSGEYVDIIATGIFMGIKISRTAKVKVSDDISEIIIN